MSQMDQKTYWGLGEVVMWIRTRDYERVATVSDLSETEALSRPCLIAVSGRRPLRSFTSRSFKAASGGIGTAPSTRAALSWSSAMVRAMFTLRTPMALRSLLRFATTNCDADGEAAAPMHGRGP
jgi:hypothetical protein